MVTEIRSFYSLKELRDNLIEEINQYEAMKEEYSQWLGSFLRSAETTHGKEEWFKQMTLLQKTIGGKGKKEKAKKQGASTAWIQYKDISLSTSEQGEAEILFEAIEEINKKIEQLEKAKTTIDELEKSGLGKNILYITYLRDGVPQKIFLRHKKETETAEKFQYAIKFSTTNQ
jgi:hypothetical protein